MAKGGKEYRRLVAAFERIFGATIFFGSDSLRQQARVTKRSRFNFLREAQSWYNRDHIRQAPSEGSENVIVLSDEFYQEITTHPIPTDLDAVRVLAPSPAVLDLFMWLAYRCFSAKGEESIPIFGDYGLAAQLGNVEYARPGRFREKLEEWLKTIRAMWPECPAKVNASGTHMSVKPAFAVHRKGGHDACA